MRRTPGCSLIRHVLRHAIRLLGLLAALCALPALAQEDPPDRVGRVAWVSGDVRIQRIDARDRDDGNAPLNQPLTAGDAVFTAPGARAELHIGAMRLRLDENTRLAFERLDDDAVQARLNGGRLIATTPDEELQDDLVVDTALGRFRPLAPGAFRLDADGSGVSASVDAGALRFESGTLALELRRGENVRLWPDASGRVTYRMGTPIVDTFTRWSATRDREQRMMQSAAYVSPRMTGAQDLDIYGDWSTSTDYGALWIPRSVPFDWAPYRNGRWVWIAPWGWTWIGHEPWGFAPFHYGRWVQWHGVWAWAPGARVARPAYAPALVTWGNAAGVTFTFRRDRPPVHWHPLAPREVYVPIYRSSPTHAHRINAPHADRHAEHFAPPHRVEVPTPMPRETTPPQPRSAYRGPQEVHRDTRQQPWSTPLRPDRHVPADTPPQARPAPIRQPAWPSAAPSAGVPGATPSPAAPAMATPVPRYAPPQAPREPLPETRHARPGSWPQERVQPMPRPEVRRPEPQHAAPERAMRVERRDPPAPPQSARPETPREPRNAPGQSGQEHRHHGEERRPR